MSPSNRNVVVEITPESCAIIAATTLVICVVSGIGLNMCHVVMPTLQRDLCVLRKRFAKGDICRRVGAENREHRVDEAFDRGGRGKCTRQDCRTREPIHATKLISWKPTPSRTEIQLNMTSMKWKSRNERNRSLSADGETEVRIALVLPPAVQAVNRLPTIT